MRLIRGLKNDKNYTHKAIWTNFRAFQTFLPVSSRF
jgi:hypothetical protein